jgi:5-amino-6-(5-phosphoribosylamino)uracil reductase
VSTSELQSPFNVIGCLAITLDGKIGFADTEKYTKLGTNRDIQHLKHIRDLADTMLMGGKTFRAYPKPHMGQDETRLKRHVILTKEVTLEKFTPNLPLFHSPVAEQPNQIVFVSNIKPSNEVCKHFPETVHWLDFSDQSIPNLLKALQQLGSTSILVEGGGEVVRMMLDAEALDELYLTLCPKIIGGTEAPILCGGPSLKSIDPVWEFELLSTRIESSEVFLHYRKQKT